MDNPGAALALLDSVYLPLHLPSTIQFTTVCYGLPRVSFIYPGYISITVRLTTLNQVGNQDFANYVDAHLSLTHINNKEDPIPIVPGMFLGYVHPSGEVHIQDSGSWDACPGTCLYQLLEYSDVHIDFVQVKTTHRSCASWVTCRQSSVAMRLTMMGPMMVSRWDVELRAVFGVDESVANAVGAE